MFFAILQSFSSCELLQAFRRFSFRVTSSSTMCRHVDEFSSAHARSTLAAFGMYVPSKNGSTIGVNFWALTGLHKAAAVANRNNVRRILLSPDVSVESLFHRDYTHISRVKAIRVPRL